MICVSTRRQAPAVSFREALFRGQAPDGGLYVPASFPRLERSDLLSLAKAPYVELAYEMARRMLGDEIPDDPLQQVASRAYFFAPRLQPLEDRLHCLELFLGPTYSFKDFGAQFMAKAMGYFAREGKTTLTILVATSGDTGSAVAHAYHGLEGIRIVLLYPSGKVSPLQEKQFTTLGGNVCAIEVDGTFDDCQAMVKQAFADDELNEKVCLSSANSINIGRLIPQSFYYIWAVAHLLSEGAEAVVVCVPSGNFGNLTAGLFAERMGLPVARFIAAVNANAVVPEYLETGEYRPRPSVRTYSNAMDVGAPSNWERIRFLFDDRHADIAAALWSTSVDDPTTLSAMRRAYQRWKYVVDPHTAVGLEAVDRFESAGLTKKGATFVSLSTAHPGKFGEVTELALGLAVELPDGLKQVLEKEKCALIMKNEYTELKDYLWHSV